MADERVKRAEFYERKALEARAKAETNQGLGRAPDDVACCFHVGSHG
jgi:hypothetical protein